MNNSQGHIHNFHRLCKTCHFISKSITHWFVPIYISLIVTRLENVAFEWSFWTSKMVYDVSVSSCAEFNYGWFITVSPIKERILKSLEDIVATLRVKGRLETSRPIQLRISKDYKCRRIIYSPECSILIVLNEVTLKSMLISNSLLHRAKPRTPIISTHTKIQAMITDILKHSILIFFRTLDICSWNMIA